jgi:hypothetical protein
MRTMIYLATARGLAVIQGCDESWVGEVCLNDKQIQCVAADRTRKGIVYCGTFGDGMLRSSDRGATWNALQNFTEPNVMALASSQSGALYAGTELSAMYRSGRGIRRHDIHSPSRAFMRCNSYPVAALRPALGKGP